MEITYSKYFQKKYKKLSVKDQKQFSIKLQKFIENPQNPILKVHNLKGKLKGLSAFSIKGDLRLIYEIKSEKLLNLVDIGTHNQVY
jgi:addiction module RelE/StbE family toxin